MLLTAADSARLEDEDTQICIALSDEDVSEAFNVHTDPQFVFWFSASADNYYEQILLRDY